MVFIFLQTLLFTLIFLGILLKMFGGKYKRWGGVGLIGVFVMLVLLHEELELTVQLKGLLVGSGAILIFGLWDDWKNLNWKIQILFQVCLVGILVYFGFRIDYFAVVGGSEVRIDQIIWQGISLGSVAFIFLWVIGIINAINWLDGVDSSMGAVAIIGGLGLIFVSHLPEVNQPAIAILASIFLGTVVGFLYFNLPPAKVEAGTSGSYFVGFVLASLAIIAGSKIITLMIVLVLPLMDLVVVIVRRYLKGCSIFNKDKRHLHYRLQKIGWSDWKIFWSYFIFLGVILKGYSLLNSREERLSLIIGEIILLGLFFVWVDKRYKKC